MTDSDAGTSTGSTPYESEEEMICHITGCTKASSEHSDLPGAMRCEGRSHSRQMQTEMTPMAGASEAAAGILGNDAKSHLNNTSVYTSDVGPAISADGSAESLYTMRHSNERTTDITAINRLSVSPGDGALGIDPNIQQRLTKTVFGKKAKYQVSEAPANSGQSSDKSNIRPLKKNIGDRTVTDQASTGSVICTRNLGRTESMASRDSGMGSMRTKNAYSS